MGIGPLGLPSVQEVLFQKYATQVASGNMQEAKAVVENAKERVRSMQAAGDVISGSIGEFYTQKGQIPSVNEKVGKLLDIKA